MTAGDVWQTFRRWRRRRPFWGGFFLLLAGAELFYTANASIAGLSLHLGPTGFLSYLLPLILIVCALLCLFSPAQRLFYGIVALLTALYSFIGLNLGGFFLGMLLGIVGGALVIAWGPPRIRPVNPDFVPIADQIAASSDSASPDSTADSATDSATASTAAESEDSEPETEHVELAGHDDRPTEEVRPAVQDSGIVPGFDDQEGPKSGSPRSRFTKNPRALTVALIVMGLTAGMLAVGSRVPASAAADCPPGLPSRAASATESRPSAAAHKAAAGSADSSSSSSSSSSTPTSAAPTTASPTASPTESGSGSKVVDGVKGIVDGVSNLLGLGDDPSTPPSTLPASPGNPTTDPAKTADPTTTAGDSPTTPAGAPATTTDTPSSPAPSDDDNIIPCLGPRIFGLNAGADGVPLIAGKPGLLETDLLTMYNSTYDGVVNLPTGAGTSARVLKFSMDRAVNKPFSLTTDAQGGGKTVITSNELTTDGHVEFYTARIEGKLFGLIPVVFTPDQPPPLTLPILWFTDVKIQLNYVQCDVLTGIPLHIKQK